MGEADLGAFDLTVAGFTAQVMADLPDVGDAGRGDRMTLRLETARHVHRRLAVTPRGTRVEEVGRAALFAQTEVVVVHELGGGEAVVQLDEVEIRRTDTGLLVGLLGRVLRQLVDVGQHLARLFVRVGREDRRADLDGAALLLERQRLELRAADHDRGGRTVAVGRAHRPRIRVGDHHVAHDLFERHLLRVRRERIQRGVRVVLLADLGEQLEGRAAVLVAVLHADLREHARHRVGADATVGVRDRAVATRRLVLLLVALARRRRHRAGPRRRASRRRRRGRSRSRPP